MALHGRDLSCKHTGSLFLTGMQLAASSCWAFGFFASQQAKHLLPCILALPYVCTPSTSPYASLLCLMPVLSSLVPSLPPSRPCCNRTTWSRSTSLVLVSFCELLGSGLLATQILSSAQVEVTIALQFWLLFESCSWTHAPNRDRSCINMYRKFSIPLSLSSRKHPAGPRTSSHGTHNFIQMPYRLLSTALGKVGILSGPKSRIAMQPRTQNAEDQGRGSSRTSSGGKAARRSTSKAKSCGEKVSAPVIS